MAPTVSIAERYDDNLTVALVNFTWDSTYPAGGEAVTANQLGLGTVIAVVPIGAPSGYVFNYVASTAKLMAYYADYDAGADGPLIEVAVGDTGDLDGIVTPLLVFGY